MSTTETSGRFRDESDAISPSWLNGPNGARMRMALSVLVDANADAATYAVLARFPSKAPDDALPWIGLDRQLTQGYQETSAHYRLRLPQWLDRWRFSGKPVGVLVAARDWIGPQLPNMEVVSTNATDSTSRWWSYADGTDAYPSTQPLPTPPTLTMVAPENWNWDGNAARWFRSYLIVFATTTPWITSSGTWGSSGKKWGDPSKSWGVTAPSNIMQGLQRLVKQWKRAGAFYEWIIVTFDGTLFDPAQTADGVHNPDGTFGRWSKIVSGQYVRARFANARYANGIP
jgi:hypothetical protein